MTWVVLAGEICMISLEQEHVITAKLSMDPIDLSSTLSGTDEIFRSI